jgi:hypothetical protein
VLIDRFHVGSQLDHVKDWTILFGKCRLLETRNNCLAREHKLELERYTAHTLTLFSIFFFPVSHHYYNLSKVARYSWLIMSETCIKFGEHGARVMIEDKEIPHYASHVDLAKKEVSCWIPSEEGKVRGSLFAIEILFIQANLGLYSCLVRTPHGIPICV